MKKHFEVSSVCREDIISLLQDGRIKATTEQINSLTDEEMEDIAQNMGESFTESGVYWDSLEALAREVLGEKKLEINTGDCDKGEHPAIKRNGVCMSCGRRVRK